MTTCPAACFPILGASMWGMSTSSKPRSNRLCLELSGRKKKAPKHSVMKALRMRSRMNFSESLSVARWCGKEEAPGESAGILRPESGSSAGVVMMSLEGAGVAWEGFGVYRWSRGAWCSSRMKQPRQVVLSHPSGALSTNQAGLISLADGLYCCQGNGHLGSEGEHSRY